MKALKTVSKYLTLGTALTLLIAGISTGLLYKSSIIQKTVKEKIVTQINTQFTQKFMQSVIITNTRYKKGGKISYVKTGLNEYGRATGSPHGYGKPPKNSF